MNVISYVITPKKDFLQETERENKLKKVKISQHENILFSRAPI